MTNKDDIVQDLKFCAILAKRLAEDAEKDITETPYNIYGYTPIENDIVRLRRELNKVNKKIRGET